MTRRIAITRGVSAGAESGKPDSGAQVSGSYQHYSAYGDLNLSGSYKADEYNSLSASWSGSFTSTAKGAALHRRSYGNEPRVMVSTDGVGNIPLNMSRDETNRFGIGVLPSFSSYSPSSVQVNMNNLPDGVDVDSRVVTSTRLKGPLVIVRLPRAQVRTWQAFCGCHQERHRSGRLFARKKAICRLGWWPMKATSG